MHLIDFKGIDWVAPSVGVRFKAIIKHNKKVRLVEFSEGFIESDWCRNGHVGYVLDGSFTIDFNGTLERYEKGDILFVPQGENDKHKVIMEKNGWVQLLLIEDTG